MTNVTRDPRPTVDAPDDDPWLWLEDIEGADACVWADARSAETLEQFADARMRADAERLTAYLDRPDKLPWIVRRGAHVYNFWTDAEHPKGLWRRSTLASFRSAAPDWDVLLDIGKLSSDEGADWTASSFRLRPGAQDLAIVALSRGGSDAVVLREFDLTSRSFVEGGFELAEAKSGVDWLDRDTLLLASALGEGHATASGYARTIRLWRRGADAEAAPVIFEADENVLGVHAGRDPETEPERIWFLTRTSFFEQECWLGDRSGAMTRLEIPADCEPEMHLGQLLLQLRSDWTIGGATYPSGALLAIGLDTFLGGDRGFELLFEPAERRVLDGVQETREGWLLSIRDNLKPSFETVEPDGSGGWRREAIGGLPETGESGVGLLDGRAIDSDGTLIARTEDPLTPPTLLLREPGVEAWEMLRQAPTAFDASGLAVERREAVSTDGARIPYVEIRPQGAAQGDLPVYMTGYGGFEVSIRPTYSASIGQMWLEQGGVCVLANIRGGGEFGPAWHEAGRREGKRLSHDDFAAIAADLAARGVTKPERIAAEGGSNGGLLIGNMLARYPERFGALLCTIPLADMRRYSKLLAGASWIAEYGDPEVPADWAFIKRFSAYHTASRAAGDGAAYPPTLFMTTRRDDRVHPGHARKMAAKLMGLGHDIHFFERATGGHGSGTTSAERSETVALGFNFLRRKIGWECGAV